MPAFPWLPLQEMAVLLSISNALSGSSLHPENKLYISSAIHERLLDARLSKAVEQDGMLNGPIGWSEAYKENIAERAWEVLVQRAGEPVTNPDIWTERFMYHVSFLQGEADAARQPVNWPRLVVKQDGHCSIWPGVIGVYGPVAILVLGLIGVLVPGVPQRVIPRSVYMRRYAIGRPSTFIPSRPNPPYDRKRHWDCLRRAFAFSEMIDSGMLHPELTIIDLWLRYTSSQGVCTVHTHVGPAELCHCQRAGALHWFFDNTETRTGMATTDVSHALANSLTSFNMNLTSTVMPSIYGYGAVVPPETPATNNEERRTSWSYPPQESQPDVAFVREQAFDSSSSRAQAHESPISKGADQEGGPTDDLSHSATQSPNSMATDDRADWMHGLNNQLEGEFESSSSVEEPNEHVNTGSPTSVQVLLSPIRLRSDHEPALSPEQIARLAHFVHNTPGYQYDISMLLDLPSEQAAPHSIPEITAETGTNMDTSSSSSPVASTVSMTSPPNAVVKLENTPYDRVDAAGGEPVPTEDASHSVRPGSRSPDIKQEIKPEALDPNFAAPAKPTVRIKSGSGPINPFHNASYAYIAWGYVFAHPGGWCSFFDIVRALPDPSVKARKKRKSDHYRFECKVQFYRKYFAKMEKATMHMRAFEMCQNGLLWRLAGSEVALPSMQLIQTVLEENGQHATIILTP